MVRVLLFILIFINFLHSALLLEDRFFSGEKSTEIVLFFNLPFEGNITKEIASNQIIISLKKAKINKTIKKILNSNTIKSYHIYQAKEDINIVIITKNARNLKIFRDDNNFKIKIIISSIASENQNEKFMQNQTVEKNSSLNLFLLLSTTILLVIVVYFLYEKNRKIVKKSSSYEDFTIASQKNLDEKNRLSLIKFKDKEYLVITGDSTIVLNEDVKSSTLSSLDEIKSSELEDYKKKVSL